MSEFRLPRWQRSIPIVDPKTGNPSLEGQRWQQALVEKLEAQEAQQDATLAAIKLTQSFTDPVGVLTAREDGTIAIATHTRIYGDASEVEVIGGAVTGLTNELQYTVYYEDSGQAGGTVTYQATTKAVAQVGSVHIVGQVTVPAVAAAENPGIGPTAPGYTAPDSVTYDPRLIEYQKFSTPFS